MVQSKASDKGGRKTSQQAAQAQQDNPLFDDDNDSPRQSTEPAVLITHTDRATAQAAKNALALDTYDGNGAAIFADNDDVPIAKPIMQASGIKVIANTHPLDKQRLAATAIEATIASDGVADPAANTATAANNTAAKSNIITSQTSAASSAAISSNGTTTTSRAASPAQNLSDLSSVRRAAGYLFGGDTDTTNATTTANSVNAANDSLPLGPLGLMIGVSNAYGEQGAIKQAAHQQGMVTASGQGGEIISQRHAAPMMAQTAQTVQATQVAPAAQTGSEATANMNGTVTNAMAAVAATAGAGARAGAKAAQKRTANDDYRFSLAYLVEHNLLAVPVSRVELAKNSANSGQAHTVQYCSLLNLLQDYYRSAFCPVQMTERGAEISPQEFCHVFQQLLEYEAIEQHTDLQQQQELFAQREQQYWKQMKQAAREVHKDFSIMPYTTVRNSPIHWGPICYNPAEFIFVNRHQLTEERPEILQIRKNYEDGVHNGEIE